MTETERHRLRAALIVARGLAAMRPPPAPAPDDAQPGAPADGEDDAA